MLLLLERYKEQTKILKDKEEELGRLFVESREAAERLATTLKG